MVLPQFILQIRAWAEADRATAPGLFVFMQRRSYLRGNCSWFWLGDTHGHAPWPRQPQKWTASPGTLRFITCLLLVLPLLLRDFFFKTFYLASLKDNKNQTRSVKLGLELRKEMNIVCHESFCKPWYFRDSVWRLLQKRLGGGISKKSEEGIRKRWRFPSSVCIFLGVFILIWLLLYFSEMKSLRAQI